MRIRTELRPVISVDPQDGGHITGTTPRSARVAALIAKGGFLHLKLLASMHRLGTALRGVVSF